MHTRTIGASQVLLAGVFWGTFGTFASFLPSGVPALFVGAAKLAFGALVSRSYLPSNGTARSSAGVARSRDPLPFGDGSRDHPDIDLPGHTHRPAWDGRDDDLHRKTPPPVHGIFAQFIQARAAASSVLISSLVIASGCTFMALSGDAEVDGNRLLCGSLMAAVAGASWTFVGTLLRNLQRHAGPLESSFIVMGSAALILLPIAATQGLSWVVEPRVFIISVALGLISTAIPYWLFTTGARKIPVSHAFLYGLTEPITASFLGLVVLGERLSTSGTIGYVQVAVGLVLFCAWEFKKTRMLESKALH